MTTISAHHKQSNKRHVFTEAAWLGMPDSVKLGYEFALQSPIGFQISKSNTGISTPADLDLLLEIRRIEQACALNFANIEATLQSQQEAGFLKPIF